jgi:hypothetical protein
MPSSSSGRPTSAQPTKRAGVVPHAERVGVAQRPLRHLGTVHGPMPGTATAACCVVAVHADRLLEPLGVLHRQADGPGPLRSTPRGGHSQDGMRRQVCASGGTRMPSGAGPGAGSPKRSTSCRNDARAFLAGDLLLEHRRDPRLDHPAVRGTRSPGCGRPASARQR